MNSFFVITLLMFSVRSEACQNWGDSGCTPATPAVKECVKLTMSQFGLKAASVAPITNPGINCLSADRAGVMNYYMDCLRGGSPRNSASFIANCAREAQKMTRVNPTPSTPRPPVTSYLQCQAEIRRAIPPKMPDSTVQKYLKIYGNPLSQCDSLLSCMDKAHATNNFRLATVDACMERPAGTADGPTHPTSIQSSGQADQ